MTEEKSFQACMAFVLKWEGNYTNDPDDPGGETKYGIAKRFHPDLDIKNLTTSQALSIYEKEYWLPLGCDKLSPDLACAAMDSAVNLGVSRVKSWLEITSDWKELIELRKGFYGQEWIERPSSRKYFKGWMNRCDALKDYIGRTYNAT